MPKELFYDKQFKNLNAQNMPVLGEYESCTFKNCDFSGCNMEQFAFLETSFYDCNFSAALVSNAALKNVHFYDCKLMGVHFDHCNPFLIEMAFTGCLLNMSCLYGLKLKNTRFIDCTMHEVDLGNADLNGAVFKNCDLQKAIFDNTNLEKADFSTAYNYNINPNNNKLSKAKFSKDGLAGLLGYLKIEII